MDIDLEKIYDFSKRDWNTENLYTRSNKDYSTIYYDKYRNIYYRIVFVRPSEKEVLAGNSATNFSIIVFDDELKKLGETEVLDNRIYSTTQMAVLPEGLAIVREDKYKEDDSNLTFSIFKVENQKK